MLCYCYDATASEALGLKQGDVMTLSALSTACYGGWKIHFPSLCQITDRCSVSTMSRRIKRYVEEGWLEKKGDTYFTTAKLMQDLNEEVVRKEVDKAMRANFKPKKTTRNATTPLQNTNKTHQTDFATENATTSLQNTNKKQHATHKESNKEIIYNNRNNNIRYFDSIFIRTKETYKAILYARKKWLCEIMTHSGYASEKMTWEQVQPRAEKLVDEFVDHVFFSSLEERQDSDCAVRQYFYNWLKQKVRKEEAATKQQTTTQYAQPYWSKPKSTMTSGDPNKAREEAMKKRKCGSDEILNFYGTTNPDGWSMLDELGEDNKLLYAWTSMAISNHWPEKVRFKNGNRIDIKKE